MAEKSLLYNIIKCKRNLFFEYLKYNSTEIYIGSWVLPYTNDTHLGMCETTIFYEQDLKPPWDI